MCQTDDSEYYVHIFFLYGVQIFSHIEYQEGDGVGHSVDHEKPVEPAPGNDTEEEDGKETGKGVAIKTD